MAMYPEEEEAWKCPKHPSKRRRNGICPTCLRDRLITLCPECANVRPCSCCTASSSSCSSSSSSSSFSFFSSASSSRRVGGGRVSELIEKEPAFRRSRSVGIPFLFTRFAREKEAEDSNSNARVREKSRAASFLSRIMPSKSRKNQSVAEQGRVEQEDPKIGNNVGEECRYRCSNASIEEFASMMMRSRSVSVVSSSAKEKRWSFSSPMKAFRQQSKTPKLANDRSPMCRG
ncbi:OLC1v1031276C1 [Oldenlandia corymbosa var. corymbosa]|uniref:OLC1v1031276C1 n=1 Tax=Oldenlandia corymbosa var. corymbosa TaxID=529605 RepID=A0AAV1CJ22_OLDCO|nr:OLC1v1031276C1 [Oldenlandia corymbosa var. corymbosa]